MKTRSNIQWEQDSRWMAKTRLSDGINEDWKKRDAIRCKKRTRKPVTKQGMRYLKITECHRCGRVSQLFAWWLTVFYFESGKRMDATYSPAKAFQWIGKTQSGNNKLRNETGPGVLVDAKPAPKFRPSWETIYVFRRALLLSAGIWLETGHTQLFGIDSVLEVRSLFLHTFTHNSKRVQVHTNFGMLSAPRIEKHNQWRNIAIQWELVLAWIFPESSLASCNYFDQIVPNRCSRPKSRCWEHFGTAMDSMLSQFSRKVHLSAQYDSLIEIFNC